MNKTFKTVEEAIADIKDGSIIGIGGFFAAGVPRTLIQALIKKGTKDLTICCGSGPLLGAYRELDQLVAQNQIKKLIDSYGLFRSATKGSTHPFEQKIRSGEIEFEVYPMGTLAEKYRAAGAGIPGLLHPRGIRLHGRGDNPDEHRKEQNKERGENHQRTDLCPRICFKTRLCLHPCLHG